MTNEIMSDVIAVLRKGQEKYTILRKKSSSMNFTMKQGNAHQV